MRSFKLDELAAAAGVSVRTVRYYVQRGLLVPPEFRGKDTAYGEGHLLRLRAIKKLRDAHLPLDEIQARLAPCSDAELRAITTSRVAPLRAVVLTERSAESRAENSSGSSKTDEHRLPFAGEGARCARWLRVELASGVELHVREPVDAAARRVLAAIEAALDADAPLPPMPTNQGAQ